jgi:hypothetical protein
MPTQSPLSRSPNGAVVWTPAPGDLYLVTGKTRAGKRFRFQTPIWAVAQAINVWRGTKWLVRDNKRFIIQTIAN